jgi:sulfur carrier protein ThiS
LSATLRLSASLKTLLGSADQFIVEPGQPVRETLLAVGIQPDLVALVTVDDEIESKDYVIKDGDTIRLLAIIGGG